MKLGRKLLLSACLGLIPSVFMAGTAHAYDGGDAANYADKWALTPSGNFITFADDCTNFISQVMYVGGLKQRKRTDVEWYYYILSGGVAKWSNSWTVVQDNWDFVSTVSDLKGTWPTGTTNKYTPAWHWSGDPVYYDFDNSGDWDHASVVTGFGTDPKYPSYEGSVINQHSTNRKRVIWHLRPYNSKYKTTRYGFQHFNAGTT